MAYFKILKPCYVNSSYCIFFSGIPHRNLIPVAYVVLVD